MRVGLFGGSFDPPHLGHLAVARAAKMVAGLDRVLFAPVGLQPLKPGGAMASFEDRLAMTRLAVGRDAGFEVSPVDAPRDGKPNYTVDTLRRLKAEVGDAAELYLVMGADSFRTLPQWHRAAEVVMLAGLIVASRPWEDLGEPWEWLPKGIRWEASKTEPDFYLLRGRGIGKGTLRILPDVRYDVSATELRQSIQGDVAGVDLDGRVLAYIRARGLYR